MQTILVDSGPLVALFSRRDKHHARVAAFLAGFAGVMLTTWPVVTEVCHLISRENRIKFLQWAAAGGIMVRDMGDDAVSAMLPFMQKYDDLPMDVADASLLLLGQQTGILDVLTIDVADFSVYRLPGGRKFTIFPE